MDSLLAFHGKQSIKDFYVNRVRGHYETDQIVKGHYWKNGTGSGVGCTLHNSNHSRYETELGIPTILAHLEDGIFENLPNERAKEWPLQFLNAIPIGADLSLIWPKFARWLLADPDHGVIRHNDHESIKNVVALFDKWIEDIEKPHIEEWRKAAEEAWAAAEEAAAWAAAAAAAAAAEEAWAAAAAAAEARAAWAARAAAARAEAAAEHYIVMANKLLELLREAK